MKKNNLHLLLLLFPISIFSYGILNNHIKNESISSPATVEKQEDYALPYFILASSLLVIIIALPRLKELTFNKEGITLKLLERMEENATELVENATRFVGTSESMSVASDEDLTELKSKLVALKENIETYKSLDRKT